MVLVLWHTWGQDSSNRARQDVWARLCQESHLREYIMYHGKQDPALCLLVSASRKLTRTASLSTRSNCCQQIDTSHQAHFSGSDFAHNSDCCYQRMRPNEDIFFQSHCTAPEDTARLYNVHSATSAPYHSHHWMIEGVPEPRYLFSALAIGFVWTIFPLWNSLCQQCSLPATQTHWKYIKSINTPYFSSIFVTTYSKQKKISFCSLWETLVLSEWPSMKNSHKKLQISISQRKQKWFHWKLWTSSHCFLQSLKDYCKLRWADIHYGKWRIENNFQ